MHLDRRWQYQNTKAAELWFTRENSFMSWQNSVTVSILMQIHDSKVFNAWKRGCRSIPRSNSGWTLEANQTQNLRKLYPREPFLPSRRDKGAVSLARNFNWIYVLREYLIKFLPRSYDFHRHTLVSFFSFLLHCGQDSCEKFNGIAKRLDNFFKVSLAQSSSLHAENYIWYIFPSDKFLRG